MTEPKTPNAVSVDICNRPIPNADPASQGSWSYEQASYFTEPDNFKDGDTDD